MKPLTIGGTVISPRVREAILAPGFYLVFNFGHIPRFGAGYRHVYAEAGRKFVTLIDWSTGDATRLPIVSDYKRHKIGWIDSNPRTIEPPRPKIIRRCLKRIAALREKPRATKLEKVALAAARGK